MYIQFTFCVYGVDNKSVQTLIDNVIQKDQMFNRKTTQGFDLLYIRSNNKFTYMELPRYYWIITETPVPKDNFGSKSTSDISINIPISSDSSNESNESDSWSATCHGSTICLLWQCGNDYVRNEVLS